MPHCCDRGSGQHGEAANGNSGSGWVVYAAIGVIILLALIAFGLLG